MLTNAGTNRVAALGLLLAITFVALPTAAKLKPVVAIFTIEAKGIALDPGTLDRLSDYLATSITATGAYQVVPRDQLKRRLVAQKKRSYKKCFDQSCQIEIGKELAAQKSLASQVMKIGSRCLITATLYDLRRAAAEAGATAKGGCTEDDIVGSLEALVRKLVPNKASAASSALASPAPPRSRPDLVSSTPATRWQAVVAVDFSTEPPGAEIFIDGQARGATPLRLNLVKGKRYALNVEKDGYASLKQRVNITRRQAYRYRLRLTADGKRQHQTRTEWFSFDLAGGFVINAREDTRRDVINRSSLAGAGGMYLSVVTLKWTSFFWTVMEAGGAATAGSGVVHVSTRFGYPLYLDDAGRHHFRFGVGIGGGLLAQYEGAFLISPGVDYRYLTRSRFFIGLNLRIFLPLAGSCNACSLPTGVLFSLPMGWAAK